MSMRRKDHYTCNRCGQEEIVAADQKPINWAMLEARYLDRHYGSEGNGTLIRTGQLCSKCRNQFVDYWDEGKS